MTYSIDKVNTIKTTTYTVNSDIYKGFMIDIVDNGETREAWIYHKEYGQKSSIFGTSKDQDTLSKFLEMVTDSTEEHIEFYLEDLRALENYFVDKYLSHKED